MTEDIEQVRCPKCGGKIFFDKDYYGWYEKCLYCGWTRDLPGIVLNEGERRHGGRYSPAEDKETSISRCTAPIKRRRTAHK